MDQDIDHALELLIRYWQVPGDCDPALAYHCRLVAEAIFRDAPALAPAVQGDPEGLREAIRSALQYLSSQGPTRRTLVRQLARFASAGGAQVTVSGNGNVTLVGSFVTGDIRVGADGPAAEEQKQPPRVARDSGSVADLELWLQFRETGLYRIVMGFTPTGSTAIEQPLTGEALAKIRLDQLNEVIHEPEAYGIRLTRMLCADPQVAASLVTLHNRTRGAGAPLRLRLRLEGNDPLLTAIRWELLCTPAGDNFLFADSRMWFSRLPMSNDQAPVNITAKQRLRGVIAVAAPTDLAAYGLAPIDAPAEIALAQHSFGGAQLTVAHASLQGLAAAMLEEVDVLYLVAHGAMRDDRPVLYLVGPTGRTEPIYADALVERMKGSRSRPALVVLASCQSAGQSHQKGSGLAALGPSLARGGAGAVLAMQDNIPTEAIHTSMPVFWRELQAHGIVDQAVAAMRNVLAAGKHQWWQPVLYMRLRDGRIFQR